MKILKHAMAALALLTLSTTTNANPMFDESFFQQSPIVSSPVFARAAFPVFPQFEFTPQLPFFFNVPQFQPVDLATLFSDFGIEFPVITPPITTVPVPMSGELMGGALLSMLAFLYVAKKKNVRI